MTDREAFEAWWKLLKPAECDEVKEHFENCWQAAIDHERSKAPAWHDAPTVPGLWICSEGETSPYRWSCTRVVDPALELLQGDGEKWYGILPPLEDKP